MIPITALLNDLDDREDVRCPSQDQDALAKLPTLKSWVFEGPRSPSVESDASGENQDARVCPEHLRLRCLRKTASLASLGTASDPEMLRSPEGDVEQSNKDRDSLSESASLMGALTLQALRYSSPKAAIQHEQEQDVKQQEPKTGRTSPRMARRNAHRRSTQGLFSPASEEDRRAKQRMIVKRCYYKKIHTINDLRQQVQQLEQAFQVLLDLETKRHEAEHANATDESQTDQATRLRQVWVEVLSEKENLRHENQRLRKLADEQYMKNQSRVRALLDANRKEINLFAPAVQD